MGQPLAIESGLLATAGQRAEGGGQRRVADLGVRGEGRERGFGNLRLLKWREYGSEIDDMENVDRGKTRPDQTLWDGDRRQGYCFINHLGR